MTDDEKDKDGARHWCITIKKKKGITWKAKEDERVRYVIWQLEEGKGGYLHYQVYIEFNSPQRLEAVKKYINRSDAHCEKRKGPREKARNYCRKEESHVEGPWEIGKWIKGLS